MKDVYRVIGGVAVVDVVVWFVARHYFAAEPGLWPIIYATMSVCGANVLLMLCNTIYMAWWMLRMWR